MKYWVVVVSKDHISRGIEGGFMQANHGKEWPLKRMAVNDWVICYSPKQTYAGKDACLAFTAIGQVADDKIYQRKMSADFIPYRRNINWQPCTEAPIVPLIEKLDFIANKTSWGYQFRLGFLQVTANDFGIISAEMLKHEHSAEL